MKLSLVYAILAFVATASNIAAQELATRVYTGLLHVGVAVVAGTATGLVVKYVLDKKYIFAFQARNALHDASTFALYTLTGLFTTAVFWGFEFGFDAVFGSKGMRYTGAVIGLAIGYVLKFRLDKQHVFRAEAS